MNIAPVSMQNFKGNLAIDRCLTIPTSTIVGITEVAPSKVDIEYVFKSQFSNRPDGLRENTRTVYRDLDTVLSAYNAAKTNDFITVSLLSEL